jgi:hypothetical protein
VQNPKLRYFKPFELFDHTGCDEPVRNKGRFISGHNFENQGKGDQHVSLHADRKQPLASEWRKTRKPYSGPPSWLGQEK